MDGRTDTLTDAALEQEVEALLSVQPSPDFVARVRSRVDEESMSAGWGWRWPMAAVATTVAVAVVGAMGTVLWQPVTPTEPRAPQSTAVLERPVPEPPVQDRAVIVPRQAVSVAPPRSIDLALPPVIIAENETRAFAVLVRTAPNTEFDFVAAAAYMMAPVEVDKMPAIDLIEIKPLVRAVELE
jgi:hypothetical protein